MRIIKITNNLKVKHSKKICQATSCHDNIILNVLNGLKCFRQNLSLFFLSKIIFKVFCPYILFLILNLLFFITSVPVNLCHNSTKRKAVYNQI